MPPSHCRDRQQIKICHILAHYITFVTWRRVSFPLYSQAKCSRDSHLLKLSAGFF